MIMYIMYIIYVMYAMYVMCTGRQILLQTSTTTRRLQLAHLSLTPKAKFHVSYYISVMSTFHGKDAMCSTLLV